MEYYSFTAATVLCCCLSMMVVSAGTADILGGIRMRHGANRFGNILQDSQIISRLQGEILSNLGMSEVPTASADDIPEQAREVLIQEAEAQTRQTGRTDDGAHFMAENSNVLLIANKVNTGGFGETIQFVVKPEDRATRMSDIKLYYLINSDNITMLAGSAGEEILMLRLTLLSEENGSTTSRLVENIHIHKRLMGWHNQVIDPQLIDSLLQGGSGSNGSITLNFQLTCLNCLYKPFPTNFTKHNAPFLRMNGRRRSRRNSANVCNGRCCMRELIVDFAALGWNWVLWPRQYTANYCTGSCHNPNASERTHMSSNSQIVNNMLEYLSSGSVSSCCVPRDEEPMTMVYTDDSGEIRTNVNILKTVTSCRCS